MKLDSLSERILDLVVITHASGKFMREKIFNCIFI